MLFDYILKIKGTKAYVETNAPMEEMQEMITDYEDSVEKPTVTGLYHYVMQQGYSVEGKLSINDESADKIFEL